MKFFSKKVQLGILCIGLYYFIISCQTENKTISNNIYLSTWIADKDNFENLIFFFEKNDCEQAEKLLSIFKDSQFKNQSYLPLARCFSNDNEKSLKYLTKALKAGYNIKLIDSILFEDNWEEIKAIYPKLNKEYWAKQDTIYFKEVEQLVYLDQKVRYDRPMDSNDFSEEIKQDSISTRWFLNYCQKQGYPKIFQASQFSSHRRIDPTILAIHAEDIYKKEILVCAIGAAQAGKISWSIPIYITTSFYVVRKPPNAVNPLFMLYFDEDDNLDYKKSLLQVYSIKEQYGSYMPSTITLRPSLTNKQHTGVIEKQLNQIKGVLVNEFLFDENLIVIDFVPSKEKVYDDFVESYLYTISAERL